MMQNGNSLTVMQLNDRILAWQNVEMDAHYRSFEEEVLPETTTLLRSKNETFAYRG